LVTNGFHVQAVAGFLAGGQPRSFSRAAEALYSTASGLSVLLRELETQLGFRLFDRTMLHVGKLSNPVVNADFSRLSLRGKQLPPSAEDFTFFLQGCIAPWAGRAGIL
jgi:hypothetical protein